MFPGLTFCYGSTSSCLELDPDREAHGYLYLIYALPHECFSLIFTTLYYVIPNFQQCTPLSYTSSFSFSQNIA